jgi:hypothetical protein
MVQKYIAAILVLTLLGLATPAMAGDLVNPNLIPKRPTYAGLAPGLAFSPQQTSPSAPGTPAKSGSGELTTAGKVMKWVGIGLIASGGAETIYAATIKDPCAGISGPYVSCTSNYSTVRAVYYGSGGASIGVGAILLIVGLHKKM